MNNEIIENVTKILEPFKNKCEFNFRVYENLLEVHGLGNTTGVFILLRASILTDCKQIHIHNIFIPDFMKHKGIGKLIIRLIFEIASKYGYELFVVDMVQSFYKRLIKRNAYPCDFESVQITNDTDLYSHYCRF